MSTRLHIPFVSGAVLFIALLVFLPNRYYVPYALRFGSWEIGLFTLALAPLFFFVYPQLLLRAISRGTYPRQQLFYTAAFWAWFVISLSSTFLNSSTNASFLNGLLVLSTVAIWLTPLWIVPLLPLSMKDVHTILILIFLLACISAIPSSITSLGSETIAQLFGPSIEQILSYRNTRAGLPLGVSTVIGSFFLISLPIGFAYFTRGMGTVAQTFGFSLLLLLALGCLSTGSRATYLILPIVFLLSLLYITLDFGLPPVRSRIPGLIVLLVITIFAVVLFPRLRGTYDGSVAWRIRGIETATEMISERPFFGVGVETHFKRQAGTTQSILFSEYPEDAIIYNYRYSPREPHNLFFLIASESGLIGLLCFALFLLGLFRYLSFLAQGAAVYNDALLRKAGLISFISMMLHSLFGSDLQARERMAILFWILCGLLCSASPNGRSTKTFAPDGAPTDAPPANGVKDARMDAGTNHTNIQVT